MMNTWEFFEVTTGLRQGLVHIVIFAVLLYINSFVDMLKEGRMGVECG